MINKDLLKILACPKCNGLVCEQCKLFYPVRDGIPVMLIGEVIPIG